MAPVTRPLKAFDLSDYPDAKVAAVMILLYPKQDTIFLALIKRPDYSGVHSGQVSFPGGKSERFGCRLPIYGFAGNRGGNWCESFANSGDWAAK